MSIEPDRLLVISLIGSAERLLADASDPAAAAAELRDMARRRTDLLSDAAGYFLGAQHWNSPGCYQLLVDAGADDQERIEAAAATVSYNRVRFGRNDAGINR